MSVFAGVVFSFSLVAILSGAAWYRAVRTSQQALFPLLLIAFGGVAALFPAAQASARPSLADAVVGGAAALGAAAGIACASVLVARRRLVAASPGSDDE